MEFTVIDQKGTDGLKRGLYNTEEFEKMNSSLHSTFEDTTPSDSGVQLLDSDSSEQMAESLISQSEIEYEEAKHISSIKDDNNTCKNDFTVQSIEQSYTDKNSNFSGKGDDIKDAMIESTISTYDTSESIVYRRKARKQQGTVKAPKKRVSFHEDILKNTRTDNIHIEHGFVTYKNNRKFAEYLSNKGRYSWCSEGAAIADGITKNTDVSTKNQLYHQPNVSDEERRVVYRNACSDVLDYGDTDVFDTNEGNNRLHYDNSGVFEYLAKEDNLNSQNIHNQSENNDLCRCSCSSSNSSLDLDGNDKNCNRQRYSQAKSSSCDCIGMNNTNNNVIGNNCYYSEPNMEFLNEKLPKKSVWNKEKKPKSSCLKKTKRYTDIIQEQDLNNKVKKFNVHDMNQLLDNSSKMIIGSLRSIFTMPLPERGVAEGAEDLTSVLECLPELEHTPEHKPNLNSEILHSTSPPLKSKPYLSKSLDGSKISQATKKFVHNVDEQLRRKVEEDYKEQPEDSCLKNDTNLSSPVTTNTIDEIKNINLENIDAEILPVSKWQSEPKNFRNKFIINCESTVFEHTGVSYTYDSGAVENYSEKTALEDIEFNKDAQKPATVSVESDQVHKVFLKAPLAKTFSNFFRSFKDAKTTNKAKSVVTQVGDTVKQEQNQAANNYLEMKLQHNSKVSSNNLPSVTSSSSISDFTSSTASLPHPKSNTSISSSSNGLVVSKDIRANLDKQSRHLASPLKKRISSSNLLYHPRRYSNGNNDSNDKCIIQSIKPDSYGLIDEYMDGRDTYGRDSKNTNMSDEFDDILTITTDTDRNESDIVIVNFPFVNDAQAESDINLLKPPPNNVYSTKSSLINRFLRNVTQKKILESTMRQNQFFASKLKKEQKLFHNNLYVPGVKPKNYELIEDLNAEIAMEIEMSGVNSPRRELVNIEMGDVSRFELGIGEISIDIFNGNYLHILRDPTETLMKVFKLYTGYSREGYMTPVLVFLTDKTLYVTDLVRNRLCSKFVLAYEDLDVILMGPYGNTVLLSNSIRDMQQVLLAGGPYPADGLVANLELCARRSGSKLPAVGQLSLQHLAPLQQFVSENSSVYSGDEWMYYAVVNVPASAFGSEKEPFGPYEKGFLMHRQIKDNGGHPVMQPWNPGYFLLKAGVLYMFNDSNQKIPSWAMALAECQGARRSVKAGRPHCFEIMLRDKQLLQLAAPDEYVASEWLQSLLQAASGLFEMQDKHKTLGCTLVVTQNHLITLREDFNMPLQELSKQNNTNAVYLEKTTRESDGKDVVGDCDSMISSNISTPTMRMKHSSINSTPTNMSQFSHSKDTAYNKSFPSDHLKSSSCYLNMSSVYGKNSGVEVLTCAGIKEMIGIKIPSHNDIWWCILEFSCQEVHECSDDLVIFFASSSEMQRFLRLMEQLWHVKNNDLFPITVLDEDDLIAEHCTELYMDINRSWEPLLTAALGYPL